MLKFRTQFVVGLLLRLPSSKSKIASELGQARRDLEAKLVPEVLPVGSTYTRSLPKQGKTPEWLKDEMDRLLSMEKSDVKEGRGEFMTIHRYLIKMIWYTTDTYSLSLCFSLVSGTVYYGEDLNQVIVDSVVKNLLANPLHPDVFPGGFFSDYDGLYTLSLT
jgi:sphinganine-1-phosphate aldolase